MSKSGCVYFIKHKNMKPVKIGFSSNTTPTERIQSMATASPYGLELMCFIQYERAKKLELLFHRIFKHKRINGEWFDLSKDDLMFIKEITRMSDEMISVVHDDDGFDKILNDEFLSPGKHYNSDLCEPLKNLNSRIIIKQILLYCELNQKSVTKGRDHKGRYLVITNRNE